MFALLLTCHLIGDFILQNDWMQAKSKSSHVCTIHVICYITPFILAVLIGLPAWMLIPIFAQHWLQDRFALHTVWMRAYGQTPPEKWPVGPLCIDQAFHVAFLGVLTFL